MVQWSIRAAADLDEIQRFIAADNPEAANSWIARLRNRALEASKLPHTGRVVRGYNRDDIREVFLKTYRIVYLVFSDGILVLAVSEGHKLLENIDPDAVE